MTRALLAQSAFLFVWSAVCIAVLVATDTWGVTQTVVVIFLGTLFTVGLDLGSRPWWRTRTRWVILGGSLAYLAFVGQGVL
jgi:hypothetical protein